MVRAILVDAIGKLQSLLASLDAKAAGRSGEVAEPAASQTEAPQAKVEAQRPAEPTSTISGQKPGAQGHVLPTGTRRVKKANSFWDDMEAVTTGGEPAKVPEPVVQAQVPAPPPAGRLPIPFFTVFPG